MNAVHAISDREHEHDQVSAGEARDELHAGTDEARHRDREDPGDQDVAGDAPADCMQAAGRAGAHHRPGDHVRGRDGEAEVRRRPEDRRARGLGREALRRVDLRDPRAEGADDPPAAGVGSRRHRQRRGRDHPGRRPREVGVEVPGRDERERDDAHRLLRVVRAVGEGDEAAGDELAAAEVAVDLGRRAPRDEPDDDRHQREGERRARRRVRSGTASGPSPRARPTRRPTSPRP